MLSDVPLKIDHFVIVVTDLDQAISNFTELGFNVERGGINGPIHNAIIFLKNQVYIELIATRSRFSRIIFRGLFLLGVFHFLDFLRPLLYWRFACWLGGAQGLRDWCIKSDDIDRFCSLPKREELNISRKHFFSRERPDGEVLNWFLAGPSDRNLPFLIQDITDHSLRIPLNSNCEHPNKVEYVSTIILNRDKVLKHRSKFLHYLALDESADEVLALDGVHIRVSSDKSAPMMVLEFSSDGGVSGELSKVLTAGASLRII